MQIWRRVRGLLGTAATWSAFGAIIGLPLFLVVFPPWPPSAVDWPRLLRLLGMWESAALLWGGAVGLAFGVSVLVSERRRTFSQLSAGRITLFGGIAGVAFPLLLFSRQLLAGSGNGLPTALIVAGLSAVGGALWARWSFGLARRHGRPAQAAPQAPQLGEGAAQPFKAVGQRAVSHEHGR